MRGVDSRCRTLLRVSLVYRSPCTARQTLVHRGITSLIGSSRSVTHVNPAQVAGGAGRRSQRAIRVSHQKMTYG
jgi:hypothetical protein